jgi:multicomponent K+:H+ antiporter subunit C
MEFLVASAIGVMTAAGIYLILRARTFPVVIGLSLLTYATNLFLFATGRLAVNQPPVISATNGGYVDPLPQALVLTAIVISFGMTAVLVVMSLRSFIESGDDGVDVLVQPTEDELGGSAPRTAASSAREASQ